MKWLAAGALLLASCARAPEDYAPPRQFQHGFRPGVLKPWIAMNDPRAEEHLAAGVGALENDRHRWAGSRAALKFHLPITRALKLQADLSVSGATFPKTGPVTVVFRVNDREFDRVRYDSAGERRYEKAVDAALLRVGENSVTIETSPAAEPAQALVLIAAGFGE